MYSLRGMPVKALAVLFLWLLLHGVCWQLLPFQPDKLRNRRKDLKLTQADLAEELGVAERTVQNWEGGKTKPRLKHRLDVNRLLQETEHWESDDAK